MIRGEVVDFYVQSQVTDAVEEKRQKPRKKPIGEELIFYRKEIPILSAKDLDTLGPLQWAVSRDSSPGSVLEGILKCIQGAEIQAIATGSDPTGKMKALCAMSMAYEILSNAGYKEFLPHHRQLQVALYRLAMTSKKILTRKMFDPETSDEEADQISDFLIEISSWKRKDGSVGNA
jgi:hypothetical protein